MKHLAVLVLLALTPGCAMRSGKPAQSSSHSPAAPASYYLLPGTASPKGTYAVAWGIHGNSNVDFKRLENGDDAYLDSLLGEQGQNVRDYIVNKKTKQIVGTLKGVRYFKIADRSENHGSLTAAWTSDEELTLVVHGGKWTFQSFDAVTLRNGRLHRQNDIGTSMTKAIGTWLGAHYPAQYPPVKDKVVIDVERPVLKANNVTFTADVLAEIPKDDTGFSFEGKGTFKLQKHSNGSVTVSLVSIVAS